MLSDSFTKYSDYFIELARDLLPDDSSEMKIGEAAEKLVLHDLRVNGKTVDGKACLTPVQISLLG